MLLVVLLLAVPLIRRGDLTGSLIVLSVLILGLVRGTLEDCRLLLLIRINMLPLLLIGIVVVLPTCIPLLRTHHGMARTVISHLVGVSGAPEARLNGRAHSVRTLHARVLRTMVSAGTGARIALLLLRHHLIVIGIWLLIVVILLVVRMYRALRRVSVVVLRYWFLVLMVVRVVRRRVGLRGFVFRHLSLRWNSRELSVMMSGLVGHGISFRRGGL